MSEEEARSGKHEQQQFVREAYGSIPEDEKSTEAGCCDTEPASESTPDWYENEELDQVPEDAEMGLGCGNPVALARLSEGERVLDLGSGAGVDCFLAARQVGEDGHVIGVDMTPEMLEEARNNAAESDLNNVEFRLGEIEHLPVADGSVDVVISNCVLNLSPDKPQTIRESYRVLCPGGRLSITDLLATEPLPEDVRNDPDLIEGCVGNAATITQIENMLQSAGFEEVQITKEAERHYTFQESDLPIISARIEGQKPQ